MLLVHGALLGPPRPRSVQTKQSESTESILSLTLMSPEIQSQVHQRALLFYSRSLTFKQTPLFLFESPRE